MAIILGEPYQPNYPSFTVGKSTGGMFGGSMPSFGYAQMAGVLVSTLGSFVSARAQKNEMRFQGNMAMLNARSAAQMGSINANYTSKATLLGASYAEAMARIQSNAVRQTAEFNSKIAEMGAQAALEQGQQQAASLTLRAGQMKSSQRAAMAANGIDLGVGSAAEVLATTDIMKEIDQNQIEANAIRNAWGYRTQGVAAQIDANTQAVQIEIRGMNEAAGIRQQGAADLFQIRTQAARDEFGHRWTGNASYAASNAISPFLSSANTLATGALGVADSWMRWKKLQ
jgi:hypothetical protein